MINLLLIIFINLNLNLNYSKQLEPIHWNWVKADSIFISNYISTATDNPTKIVKYFPLPEKPFSFDTLGFGYTYFQSSVGKGYVSCFYQLVLYKGKLVSFYLSPQLPDQDSLKPKYIKLYSKLFKFSSENKIEPFIWNVKAIQKPIKDKRFEVKATIPKDSLTKILMAPYSGIDYGYTGGFVGSKLENRAIFEKIDKQLTKSLIASLLHSINPATRMMTIEYIYRNNFKTSISKEYLMNDIKVILNECPRIPTFYGCTNMKDNSKELLQRFLKTNKN